MRSRPVRLSTSWFKEARSVSEGQYNEKFKTPGDVKKYGRTCGGNIAYLASL